MERTKSLIRNKRAGEVSTGDGKREGSSCGLGVPDAQLWGSNQGGEENPGRQRSPAATWSSRLTHKDLKSTPACLFLDGLRRETGPDSGVKAVHPASLEK